jgi:hypothetical protein
MSDKSQITTNREDDSASKKLAEIDPSEDGRSKEWQDRSRVNLETVPEGTRTNLERDFEPEITPEEESSKQEKDDPAY